MSLENLNAERDALMAIPESEVHKPNFSMSLYLLEGSRILALLIEKPGVRAELIKAAMEVGGVQLTEENLMPMLTSRLGAARYAQASWDALRTNRKPEEWAQMVESGQELRGDMVSSARWNLRRDRLAQGTLNALQEGDGVPDLIADLDALAVMYLNKAEAFTRDKHVDAPALAAQAQELAQMLRAAVVQQSQETRSNSVALRNRAWTHLDVLMTEIRAAARYIFRKQPSKLAPFLRVRTSRTSSKPSNEESAS
ncbi:MAG: hypothetical protein AAFS10_17435 [Myxococcota bacterium]